MSEEVEVKPEESSVLQYVKAAASSSDRARTVIIVMVTTSVLVFVGFWNNSGGGWLDQRIELRRDALRFFNEPGFDPEKDGSLTPEDQERYKRAKQFISNAKLNPRSPDDKEQLLDEIKELRKVRIEKIRLIQVPFFGAVFDMNDMGIFAGITFIIVLLWFRYSLSRQLSNFRLTFKEAEDKGQLKLCYDLLAMQQVLTVPPIGGQKRQKIWAAIAKVLFFIPLLVQLEQIRLNWATRSYGYVLSEKLTIILLITNAISLLITAILTWQCVSLSLQVDKALKDAVRKVYPQAVQ
jgi:hypothetical protein